MLNLKGFSLFRFFWGIFKSLTVWFFILLVCLFTMFMEVEQSIDVIIILIFQSQQWGEGWRGVHVRHDDLLLPLSVRRNFYLQIVHCGVGGGTFWLKPETVEGSAPVSGLDEKEKKFWMLLPSFVSTLI